MKSIRLNLILVALVLISHTNLAFAQQKSITLEQCRDSAKVNWPSFKKTTIQNQNIDLINNTLNKNYLPRLTLSGSATYQSEVVVFPEINIPGMTDFFPSFPADNYRTDLQLQQIIYDGGNTKSAKTLQLAANSIEEIQIEIENYDLMERINQLYLNVVLLKHSKNILITAKTEIDENIKILKSAYSNGAILISEVNRVVAEKLKIEKQILNTNSSINSLVNSIITLTGLKITTSTHFIIPESISTVTATIPQFKIFSAQELLNQANLEMEHRSRFPKLMFFANGGYGRPGYNFMDTDLHPYGMVGINISWNIIDWGIHSMQKQKSIIKQKTIDINKEMFEKQNKLEIENTKSEISNLQNQLTVDTKIIKIKEEIKKSSWSKLQNGTITSNVYLKDFNDFKIAQQTLEINKIKLVQKEITLLHQQGVQY